MLLLLLGPDPKVFPISPVTARPNTLQLLRLRVMMNLQGADLPVRVPLPEFEARLKTRRRAEFRNLSPHARSETTQPVPKRMYQAFCLVYSAD